MDVSTDWMSPEMRAGLDLIAGADGGAAGIGSVGSSALPILPSKYRQCMDCDHGLLYARNAAHEVTAMHVCAECQGSGHLLNEAAS